MFAPIARYAAVGDDDSVDDDVASVCISDASIAHGLGARKANRVQLENSDTGASTCYIRSHQRDRNE